MGVELGFKFCADLNVYCQSGTWRREEGRRRGERKRERT